MIVYFAYPPDLCQELRGRPWWPHRKNSRATASFLTCATASLLFTLLAAFSRPASAQDIQGIEICTRESRLDRRTSCLQSNVEYLQRVLTRSALAAEQKLAAAAQDITALKNEVARAKLEAAALATQMAELQARLDRLQKANPTGQAGPAGTPAAAGQSAAPPPRSDSKAGAK